jgi:hypothetical protein
MGASPLKSKTRRVTVVSGKAWMARQIYRLCLFEAPGFETRGLIAPIA